jgi:hypothetical protein
MLHDDNFSYQKIELPYGLSTRGADRSSNGYNKIPYKKLRCFRILEPIRLTCPPAIILVK